MKLVVQVMSMSLAIGKPMNDYHDFYLKLDVLLFTCVFETFRKESINSVELVPVYYYLLLVIVGMQYLGLLMLI